MRRRRRQVLATTFVLMCVCAVLYALMQMNGEPGGEFSETADETTLHTESSFAPSTTGKTTVAGVEQASLSSSSPPEESCDDLKALVGKENELPPSYKPEDLVSLMDHGVPTHNPGGDELLIRREASEPLKELVSAATSDGRELVVLSAYRSYAKQQENFAHFTSVYGEDAETVSAPPGESQHQLGTTVDFTNAEVNYELLPIFGETDASKWLEDNAWRYGFIITYPDGDEQGTGRQWEPWEYRYVGIETAKAIRESNLSLREYLVEEGVRPLC